MAKADCAWFINASCNNVGNSKAFCGAASNNSFCSGQAPTGFTASCCCCDATINGCCEKIDKNTQAKTAMTSTIAACYANGNWANVTWNEGQTAVNNTCLLVKNGKECRYIKGSGGDACANAGYGGAALQACKDFGLPDPSITDICCCREIKLDSGVKGCCQLLTTKVGETGVKTALNITSSECTGKNQTASGSSGTTVDAKFYANQLPDGAGVNCVALPDKGDISDGTSPGQVGGEVNFNYTGMTNPLNTVNPSEVVGRVIKAVLAIIGSIFLIMVIYGGFTWMTAAGNDTKVAKGRNILVWSIAGVIVIFLSWILVAVIFEALAV